MKPRLALLLPFAALAACADGRAARQAELQRWIGRPEVELVGAMGAPNRTYDAEGMKFLTYEERRVDVLPGTGFYQGAAPFWYGGGLPPRAVDLTCDTTFTVGGGVVRAFSLRGNACG